MSIYQVYKYSIFLKPLKRVHVFNSKESNLFTIFFFSIVNILLGFNITTWINNVLKHFKVEVHDKWSSHVAVHCHSKNINKKIIIFNADCLRKIDYCYVFNKVEYLWPLEKRITIYSYNKWPSMIIIRQCSSHLGL